MRNLTKEDIVFTMRLRLKALKPAADSPNQKLRNHACREMEAIAQRLAEESTAHTIVIS